MNRIDYGIRQAMKAVDKVMPPVKPAPASEPRWTAEDRGRAAWQLEQAVRQFRKYAGWKGEL